MDQGSIAVGFGATVIFAFARWRFPAVANRISEAGIVAGVLMLIVGITMPHLNLTAPVLALFLVSCLGIGAAMHLATREQPQTTVPAKPASSTNTVGNVDNNSGIVTQGQQGDNEIRK